jgi:glycosyltransferase involved in cell wall biosynthesis
MISLSDAAACGTLGLVVIGRNEGERLARCLVSVRSIPRRVYVDSGSTDGSVSLAQREGVEVVELPVPPHFTAARARNAGLAKLLAEEPDLEFVQMVDGDCEVQPDWIDAALSVLRAEPDLALVFGRRRELYPERSIYNALCDDEWNVPIGESTGCGGDALFRVTALRQVDFYNAAMIAGEDTELSMRLRKRGWRLRRIAAEMTLHDAAIVRFGQWSRTVRSIFIWGGVSPLLLLAAILLALTAHVWWWIAVAVLFIPWPLRMAQLAKRQRRRGLNIKVARLSGVLLMVGKVPQFIGLVGYHLDRLSGRTSRLIEYKAPDTV